MRNTVVFSAVGAGLLRSVNAELINRGVSQWLWPSSIVVGDYLYVTGGEQFWPSTETIDEDTWTYVIDLTTSWNNETVIPVGGKPIDNPSQMLPVRQPLLFYNAVDNTVNRWGGWPYNGKEHVLTLWSFDAGSADVEWKSRGNVSTNSSNPISTGPFAAAVAYSNATFFSVGGDVMMNVSTSDMTVLAGLVTQDFASGAWSNETFQIYAQTQYRTMARAIFASDFGSEGYLVVVGGEDPVTEESVYQSGNRMANMADITLYDIATGVWYEQKATGDVPPPRSEFCAVGAASQSNSFELFVYGGAVNESDNANKPDDEGYLNVYILSLPAFRWFKSNDTTTARRADHACSVVGNRQMVSIGGRFVNTQTTMGYEQDPWTSTMGVFDMTELAWKNSYDPEAAAYEMPERIKEYYATGYQEPDWADASLASVFQNRVQTAATNSTSAEEIEASNAASSGETASTSTPVGAIAGGVVGGVAGIAFLSAFAFFSLRRRRQRTIPTEESHPDESKGTCTEAEPSAAMHEVDGSVSKAGPVELSSAHDAIVELPVTDVELPGHDHEARSGMIGS